MTSAEVNAFLNLDWSGVDRYVTSSENMPPEIEFDDGDYLVNSVLGKRIIAYLRDGKEHLLSEVSAGVGTRKIRRHLEYFKRLGVVSWRKDPGRIHHNIGLWQLRDERLLYQREAQPDLLGI